jgi:hypothetical protein
LFNDYAMRFCREAWGCFLFRLGYLVFQRIVEPMANGGGMFSPKIVDRWGNWTSAGRMTGLFVAAMSVAMQAALWFVLLETGDEAWEVVMAVFMLVPAAAAFGSGMAIIEANASEAQ